MLLPTRFRPGRRSAAPSTWTPPQQQRARSRNTAISFIYPFATAPTVKIVLQGAVAPAECPGNATSPQAQAAYLCLYEESHTNTAGATLNAVNRSGATIFANSTAAGGFFSYGTWAATGN